MNKSRLLEVNPDSNYNKLILSEHELYYKNDNVDFYSNYLAFNRKWEWKEPTTPRNVFEEIISRIPINKDWTFLDCGCGLGHVMYLASFYFKIIYGVEYIAEIAEIAKQNLNKLLPNNNSYKIFICDMFKLDKDIFNKTNVFYISSPFIDEKLLDKLVKRILNSLKNNDREIWIIYFYPYCERIIEKYKNIIPLVDTFETIGKVNYYRHFIENKNIN